MPVSNRATPGCPLSLGLSAWQPPMRSTRQVPPQSLRNLLPRAQGEQRAVGPAPAYHSPHLAYLCVLGPVQGAGSIARVFAVDLVAVHINDQFGTPGGRRALAL